MTPKPKLQTPSFTIEEITRAFQASSSIKYSYMPKTQCNTFVAGLYRIALRKQKKGRGK